MMQIAERVNLFLETMNAEYSKDAGHGIFIIFQRTYVLLRKLDIQYTQT